MSPRLTCRRALLETLRGSASQGSTVHALVLETGYSESHVRRTLAHLIEAGSVCPWHTASETYYTRRDA